MRKHVNAYRITLYNILYHPPQVETITYLLCGINKVQQWKIYLQYKR